MKNKSDNESALALNHITNQSPEFIKISEQTGILKLNAIKDRILVLYECEFMRNYVHIWDICRVFLFIIDNWEKCKNETFNVGNDSINMNKLQLAEKIKEYTPLEIIRAEFTQDPDKRDYIVSSQKIYDLGFKCEYDLDTGIKQLIKMYSLISRPWYGNY